MSLPCKIRKITHDEINNIDFLPEEVMCTIFDYLDLDSVKNASLTCRKWKNIIFFSGYINRFALIAWDSRLFKSRFRNCHDSLMWFTSQQYEDILKQSQRCYRHLRFVLNHDIHFTSLWDPLHPMVTKNLRSLEFSIDASLEWHMIDLIADAIPLIPQLQSLTLKEFDYYSCSYHARDIPTFRSSSVKHFEMKCDIRIKIEMPELESFDGTMPDILLPSTLSNLKQLTVSMRPEYFHRLKRIVDFSFIRHLKHLKKFKWEIEANDEALLAICETCTSLNDLSFTKQLIISNADVFSSLYKLVNLRRLQFNYIYEPRRSFFNIDLSKLTNLEVIQLGTIGMKDMRFPKSIKMLTIRMDIENEQNMLRAIVDTELEQLKILKLSIDTTKHHAFWRRLPHLKNLEVLILTGNYYKESDFLCLDAPMHRLRKLQFEKCVLDSKRFLGVEEKLPNLKELIFLDCKIK